MRSPAAERFVVHFELKSVLLRESLFHHTNGIAMIIITIITIIIITNTQTIYLN